MFCINKDYSAMPSAPKIQAAPQCVENNPVNGTPEAIPQVLPPLPTDQSPVDSHLAAVINPYFPT